jgi:hypothetical protein
MTGLSRAGRRQPMLGDWALPVCALTKRACLRHLRALRRPLVDVQGWRRARVAEGAGLLNRYTV